MERGFMLIKRIIFIFVLLLIGLSQAQVEETLGYAFINAALQYLEADSVTCNTPAPANIYQACATTHKEPFETFVEKWETFAINAPGASLFFQPQSEWEQTQGPTDERVFRKRYHLEDELMTIFYDEGLSFEIHIVWDLPANITGIEPQVELPHSPAFQTLTKDSIKKFKATPITCPDYLRIEGVMEQKCAVTALSFEEIQSAWNQLARNNDGLQYLPDYDWVNQTTNGVAMSYLPMGFENRHFMISIVEDSSRVIALSLGN
jgi:hypothetical protein